MIEHKVFIDKARYLQKPIPSSEEIDNALAQYDEVAMTQAWRNRIVVQVWDEVSSINAATPEYILENNPWADKVYMLLVDGKVIYLQTHEPYVQGYIPITAETINSISDGHANQIASQSAQFDIIQAVLADLDLLN